MTSAAGAGPVRPYVITGGRSEPTRNNLAMETLVVAVDPPPQVRDLTHECTEIVKLCRHMLSVAEVAAHMRQPLSVVKILLADLIDVGLVHSRSPIPEAQSPDRELLKEVLDGLRRL